MLQDKKSLIVNAVLGTMDGVKYEDRELLRARLKGAIISLNKINSNSMVNSLLANFRSQIEAVSREDFEFALNFNKDLIYGSLRIKS
jgi:hypothetical protein